MADDLHVELVQADRLLWSGDAHLVVARSLSGDLGVMPGHEPLLAVLADGVVYIRQDDGDGVQAAVLGGFLSVADNRVSILAEQAELASEIDVEDARRALEAARSGHIEDDQMSATEATRRAEARLRAAETA
ncbi:MAG TPA: F0F1 ATP synthase subunit epsilon [Actinopolymorphaceae bacterium]|jgi:F-type H+-transporting ATPase subunit epsilon